MNDTWIKLYRKISENGILKDHAAWAVFSWLLVNVDRKTGKRTIGRFQMADELGIKPNTLYKIIHRLEKKWEVISLFSQKDHTEVWIVNWTKYQHGTSDQSNDSQIPVKQQSITSNTKQEVENKEIEKREDTPPHKNIAYLQEIPVEDLEEFASKYGCSKTQARAKGVQLYNYCESKGKKYKNYKAFLVNAIVRDFGLAKVVATWTPPTIENEPLISPDKLAELRGKFGTQHKM